MKRCFGYVRVSTAKQGEGVSLDEQRSAIERYAATHDMRVVEWFEEKETAAKRGRPVFREVLKRLRKKEADALIIHKIDRSARNLRDWADLNEFMDQGTIHFAHESLDLSTRGGRLAADLQAVVAADYIRNLRDETRKGHEGRLKQGLFPFNAPLGYLNSGPGKPKEIDPVTGPLVREAFELYATGKYSLDTLSETMFEKGLRTKGGKRVYKPYLAEILRNPFYVGTMKVRASGETYPGKHEPLISHSLFDDVQRVLDGKAIKGNGRRQHLYRRLFRCVHCERFLVGELQKGRVYYRCHEKGCPGRTVREDTVTDTVMDTLGSISFNEKELAYLKQELNNSRKSAEDDTKNEASELERKSGLIESRLKRLTLAYLDGDLDQEQYRETKEELHAEARATAERREHLQENPEAAYDIAVRTLELAATAQQGYGRATDTERRVLVETVSSNRSAEDGNVSIELCHPFSVMQKRGDSGSVCSHQNTVRSKQTLNSILRTIWKPDKTSDQSSS